MAEEVPSHVVGGGPPPDPAVTRGPEALTLAERLIVSFHLPYAAGCLVVGAVLLLAVWLSIYAATLDPSEAAATTFTLASVLFIFLVAYAFYATHYMRRKLVQAGGSLSTLLRDGQEGYRRVFAGVAAPGPQLVVWLVLLAMFLTALTAPAQLGTGPSPSLIKWDPGTLLEFLTLLYGIAAAAVASLGLSSFAWTYWSISRGIHRFGGAPLVLRPYFEDPFLGLKPVGSLALSLAAAYFVFLGLFILLGVASASSTSQSIEQITGFGGIPAGLIVLGLLLFLLPLRRLHRRMIREKHLEGGRLSEKLAPVFQNPEANSPKDIGYLFRLDMMDRKVSSMALWPFDIRTLGKLTVIALSVTAILISRIIAIFLRI